MPFFKSKQKRGNMQRLGVIFISVGIAGVLLFSGLMLMMNTASQGDMQHPHVVCTTGIVADTVSRVAGEHVRVTHLMGPGVDPHVYRARESDMHRLASADIIFYNGLHLEGKMDDVFAQMERYTKTVAVTDAIPREKLRPSPFAGLYDPHVWFDVRIWMYTVDVIEQVLADTFPAYAQDFTENARYYRDQLAQLDQYVRDAVAMLAPEQRRLVTAHDAFGYFARAYDFDVVGLQGISTDSQVSTYDIQQLANYIVRHKVATRA